MNPSALMRKPESEKRSSEVTPEDWPYDLLRALIQTTAEAASSLNSGSGYGVGLSRKGRTVGERVGVGVGVLVGVGVWVGRKARTVGVGAGGGGIGVGPGGGAEMISRLEVMWPARTSRAGVLKIRVKLMMRSG